MPNKVDGVDEVGLARSVGIYVVSLCLVVCGTILGLQGMEVLATASISGAIGLLGGRVASSKGA